MCHSVLYDPTLLAARYLSTTCLRSEFRNSQDRMNTCCEFIILRSPCLIPFQGLVIQNLEDSTVSTLLSRGNYYFDFQHVDYMSVLER